METQEFITRGDEVFLLNEDMHTTNLKQAVGYTAMSLYGALIDLKEIKDYEQRKRQEDKINLLSDTLNSLSNALSAIRYIK